MKNKPFFPMFVDLSDKNIVVAGGGTIATRRVKTLLIFTRNITVIAPKMTAELLELGKAGRITLLQRPVKRSDFGNAYMALAVTDDWKLNDEIYHICKAEGVYVNVANNKDQCDFYFPGICMKDELVAGVTASGADHKKAREAREKIQEVLEEMAGERDR